MLVRLMVLAAGLASFQAAAADRPQGGAADLAAGREALRAGKYAEAVAKLRTANDDSALVDLAIAARLSGDFGLAETSLRRAIDVKPTASLVSDLAMIQRAQGKAKDALTNFRAAIQIRGETAVPTEDLAKDLTSAGMLEIELGEKAAKETLERAIATWRRALPPGSLQMLPAMDALGALLRDAADYGEAERVYAESLRVREAALGPNASELIATVDSLAYVLFGQKKYAEAEPAYKRLLALWENSAGPEHPMVALTLDKMAEFYAAQERYAEAEPLVQRSLALRSKTLVESFNQTGRVELMQAKLTEAEELYARAVRIGDDCKVAPAVMDPVLRIYSKILREMKRTDEADAIDRRVKAALLEKADREGRRPSPVKSR